MSEHLSDLHGLLLIADSLGDRHVPELEGKTPLEAARTPTLDRLAAEGECGLMDPIAPGIRGGSDTGHLAILGYDPYTHYPGRGPFEAMGIGDHSTPVTYGDHTGEPCPILFWGPTVRRDACEAFGKTPCAAGGAGRLRGLDIVNILTSYMGIQEKYGA